MRYDVSIIFPHGIQYFDEILKILYKYPDLELLYFRNYEPYDFIQFIEDIYKTDTVPWQHIKGKTQYLHGLGKNVWVMLIKNNKPEEVMVGEGEYQHPQCMLVNRFKWEVRERFNPVIGGERSEHHIIHVIDYESQARELWDNIGFHPIEVIESVPNPLFPTIPFHVGKFKNYSIEEVNISKLNCTQMSKDGPNVVLPITESIYFKYVSGEQKPYRDYWGEFKGDRLWFDNSPMKFDRLISDYKHDDNKENYIAIDPDNTILDGNHRISVLLSRGINKCNILRIWN